MSYPFTILPFVVDDDTLPTIPRSDYQLLVPEEPDAYDLWQFGVGAPSLIGVQSAKELTAQSDAPAYASNYISISLAEGKALLTDIDDAASATDTIAMICQLPTLPNTTSLVGAIGDPSTGGGLYYFSAQLQHRAYGKIDTTRPTGLDMTAGAWAFVAIARDMPGNKVRVQRDAGTYEDDGMSGTYTPYAGTLALGNAYLTTTATTPMYVHSMAIFDSALSFTDLAALRTRMVARAVAHGIDVA